MSPLDAEIILAALTKHFDDFNARWDRRFSETQAAAARAAVVADNWGSSTTGEAVSTDEASFDPAAARASSDHVREEQVAAVDFVGFASVDQVRTEDGLTSTDEHNPGLEEVPASLDAVERPRRLTAALRDIVDLDRLSLLPDVLLRDIVSRLPLKDATRTAVLSRRWRPLCAAPSKSLVRYDPKREVCDIDEPLRSGALRLDPDPCDVLCPRRFREVRVVSGGVPVDARKRLPDPAHGYRAHGDRAVINAFDQADPGLLRCVRLVPVKCALRAALVGGYDGSLDDDPESGFAHLDTPPDRAVGRVGEALAAAAALCADAVGAAGGGQLQLAALDDLMAFVFPVNTSTSSRAPSLVLLYFSRIDVSGAVRADTLTRLTYLHGIRDAVHRQPPRRVQACRHSAVPTLLPPRDAATTAPIPTPPRDAFWMVLAADLNKYGILSIPAAQMFDEMWSSHSPTAAALHASRLASMDLAVHEESCIQLQHSWPPLAVLPLWPSPHEGINRNLLAIEPGSIWSNPPWPPPYVQVEFEYSSAAIRPSPWPSFLLGNCSAMGSGVSLEPPWPLQLRQDMVNIVTVEAEVHAVYLKERESIPKQVVPGRVNLTVQSWATSQTLGYISLAGQFIDSEWKLHQRMLNLVVVSWSCSENEVTEAISRRLPWSPPLSTWIWFQLSANCVLSCSVSKLQLTIFHCVSCWDSVHCSAYVTVLPMLSRGKGFKFRMLNEVESCDAVLLVFASKPDLPNAMNATEISDQLGLRSLCQCYWYIENTCATAVHFYGLPMEEDPPHAAQCVALQWQEPRATLQTPEYDGQGDASWFTSNITEISKILLLPYRQPWPPPVQFEIQAAGVQFSFLETTLFPS